MIESSAILLLVVVLDRWKLDLPPAHRFIIVYFCFARVGYDVCGHTVEVCCILSHLYVHPSH